MLLRQRNLHTVMQWGQGLAAALILSLGTATTTLSQERDEVVKFPAGSSGTSIKGRLKGDATVNYILGASAGQQMNVDMTTNNASLYFNVTPKGAAEAMFIGSTMGNSFADALPASGDYVIQVYLMRNAARRNESADYTLKISIGSGSGAVAPSDTPAPDFADGDAGGPDYWQIMGTSGTVNLRALPSTSDAIVAKLAVGTIMRNLGCAGAGGDRWCQVQTMDGTLQGWIAGRLLVEAAAPTEAGSGGAAPTGGAPDVFQRPTGEIEVGWPSGCTVLFDPRAFQINAGSSCSSSELAQSADLAAGMVPQPEPAATEAIDQSQMEAYCRGEASAAFGTRPTNLTTQPVEFNGQEYLVGGTFDDNGTPAYFTCRFDAGGGFVSVAMN
jgi:hypothetical protein